jgi:hypothetical protein
MCSLSLLLQVDLPWSKPPETVLLIKKPNSIDASQAFQQVANFLHIQKNMVSPKPPRGTHEAPTWKANNGPLSTHSSVGKGNSQIKLELPILDMCVTHAPDLHADHPS